ncbi:riboflavin synthase [Salarchaeum sp. JOR-1]|uniref:riboflavin synthase n=1 Tax=Salarchaeum sp. JOR-1 TaxID=2599399 RepID=UPI001198614E|nr:riboflavin synthase [Salarchaeum sp. JOR-1]QDX39917.1 riboflavin synthase [Salarchaeum sp. JOR-1]
MFTGIVEDTGTVASVESTDDGRRLRIETAELSGFEHGQSISVSGVCLTVEAYGENWFSAFTASETLEKTYLGELDAGDAVNLERALPADGRLDGHIVQGHVDTVTEVVGIEQVGEDWTFTFALPDGYEQYVAQKGSVALDGISLTVADVDDDAGTFSVAVIPTTYELTTLAEKSAGSPVHVEVDVVAKYVERLDAY